MIVDGEMETKYPMRRIKDQWKPCGLADEWFLVFAALMSLNLVLDFDTERTWRLVIDAVLVALPISIYVYGHRRMN
jgi:hypothetical protein